MHPEHKWKAKDIQVMLTLLNKCMKMILYWSHLLSNVQWAGTVQQSGWMWKISERKGRGGLRLALVFLPWRPVPHQQSIWSLSGQQGGALTSGWLQCPNLDTQSGRDQEPSCKRINVNFIETEITFISCCVFLIMSSFRKWDRKSKFKSANYSSFCSNKLDTS